jgi:hypothetical protein
MCGRKVNAQVVQIHFQNRFVDDVRAVIDFSLALLHLHHDERDLPE